MYLNRIHIAAFLPFRMYNTDNQLIIDTTIEIRSYFNSIKVRLELACFLCPRSAVLFQFHKGTIRTGIVRLLHLDVEKFQFHKGTIRTVRRLLYQYWRLNFNSIKVRLELDIVVRQRKELYDFNSIKVRLEL